MGSSRLADSSGIGSQPGDTSMTRLTQLAMALAVGAFMLSPIVGVTSADAAKMTKEEKAAAKAKKADCKAKSKEEKGLRARRKAYNECMKG
jgi:hypothetical protein